MCLTVPSDEARRFRPTVRVEEAVTYHRTVIRSGGWKPWNVMLRRAPEGPDVELRLARGMTVTVVLTRAPLVAPSAHTECAPPFASGILNDALPAPTPSATKEARSAVLVESQ